MAETTEHDQQFEYTDPMDVDTQPLERDRTRFDPWVGIGYHLVQVIFVVVAFIIATRLAGDLPTEDAQARTDFLFRLGVIGVPAIGMAIVLRLGQFDLSVGAMAAFGMAIYAVNGGGSSALLTVIGTAVLIGAVVGAVSGALRIPAWLSTLALSFVLIALILELVDPPDPVVIGGEPSYAAATPRLALWFFGVGLGAAAIFFVLDLLRRPGQITRIEDLALGFRILLTAVALALSAGLAAYAGAMQADRVRTASPGLETIILPAILAAVLIGGVGVFGARVSLIGTMIGAFGMALLQFGAQLAGNVGVATRMYVTALPLAIFLLLRGIAAALRNERIPA